MLLDVEVIVATRVELWSAWAWCEVDRIFSRNYSLDGVSTLCLLGMILTSKVVSVGGGRLSFMLVRDYEAYSLTKVEIVEVRFDKLF